MTERLGCTVIFHASLTIANGRTRAEAAIYLGVVLLPRPRRRRSRRGCRSRSRGPTGRCRTLASWTALARSRRRRARVPSTRCAGEGEERACCCYVWHWIDVWGRIVCVAACFDSSVTLLMLVAFPPLEPVAGSEHLHRANRPPRHHHPHGSGRSERRRAQVRHAAPAPIARERRDDGAHAHVAALTCEHPAAAAASQP
jgi:hypothetical protein